MKTKELKIEAPEGYEVDWDNSSNNVIRFKPIENKITYEDIIKKVYPGKCYYINNNQTSCKQLQQLLALNKLMNVAKYLNGDWEPDFTDNTQKWYINYDYECLTFCTDFSISYRRNLVYFKLAKLALQAIEILGKEEIKKALGIFE